MISLAFAMCISYKVLMQRNSTIGELMERKRIQDGAKEYQGHTYMDLARFDEALSLIHI